jgi:uncharacterized protein YbjT (DUF2867 family)
LKTAVVIGSTGLVGQILSEGLANQSEYARVLAIVRKQAPWINPKIKNIHFDFQNWNDLGTQVKNFSSGSEIHFFCCLGTTITAAGSEENFKKIDYDYVVEFSKIAAQSNAAKLIVVSALGANSEASVFYSRIKGEMEKDIAEKFKNSISILRPSLLLGDRKEFRFAEKIAVLLEPVYKWFLFGPLKKYKPIHAKQVARVMIQVALLNKNDVRVRIFENNELMLFNAR